MGGSFDFVLPFLVRLFLAELAWFPLATMLALNLLQGPQPKLLRRSLIAVGISLAATLVGFLFLAAWEQFLGKRIGGFRVSNLLALFPPLGFFAGIGRRRGARPPGHRADLPAPRRAAGGLLPHEVSRRRVQLNREPCPSRHRCA